MEKTMSKLNLWLASGIATLALLGAGTAVAGEVVSEAQIEAAKTSEQHEAIARSYEDEAMAADRRAESHAKMAQTYRLAYAKTPRESMAAHCKILEKNYRDAASEYRKLALEHHKMAEAAR
jgi:hypothetical protein